MNAEIAASTISAPAPIASAVPPLSPPSPEEDPDLPGPVGVTGAGAGAL
jgi:hypothetical protein